MKKTESIILVKGRFNAANAKEILLPIINSKINFHLANKFSSEERFSEKDLFSTKRIEELKQSRSLILDMIDFAQLNKKLIHINSSINLELE